jgi:hypothetical protein
MNNPFKSFFVFVLCIILLATLGSCGSQTHGYNYSQHAKRGQKHAKKVHKMNRGNDLVHFKAPCNRK